MPEPQPEPAVWYVALRMQRWEGLSVGFGPIPMGDIQSPDGSFGYLPVYASLDALIAACGADVPYAAIRPAVAAQEPTS